MTREEILKKKFIVLVDRYCKYYETGISKGYVALPKYSTINAQDKLRILSRDEYGDAYYFSKLHPHDFEEVKEEEKKSNYKNMIDSIAYNLHMVNYSVTTSDTKSEKSWFKVLMQNRVGGYHTMIVDEDHDYIKHLDYCGTKILNSYNSFEAATRNI